MTKRTFTLNVNGGSYEIYAEPNRCLHDAIREDVGFTGVKEGCGTGDCGACTVWLDGEPVTSCLMLVGEGEGIAITTIEGLIEGDDLHPLQNAFIEHGALQCGYCIPGVLLSAAALLKSNPSPTANEIRQGIAGNICRCTGYTKIIEAIQAAAANPAAYSTTRKASTQAAAPRAGE